MKALRIIVASGDVRTWAVEEGWRLGWYLERDKPAPHNRAAFLCIYRVPEGKMAPIGRLSDADLMRLQETGKEEVPPEVIYRVPYWSFIELVDEDQIEITETEIRVLPPSGRDGQGAYVFPPNGMEPIAPVKVAAKKGA